MLKTLIVSTILFFGAGCSSINKSESPVNRSILLDSSFTFGLDGIPLLEFLPDIKLGFGLHYRRPTIEEEIDLNLSKAGKWKGQTSEKMPSVSPSPFSTGKGK
jgi:hypothetical protein